MNEKIIKAVNTALKALPGVPTLAEENVSFKPKLLTAWMRTTLLPSEPVQVTIGYDRTLRHNGLMQVDMFFPANTGSSPASVETVINWFNNKDNRFMTQDGERIIIESAWRGTASTNTDWYRVPVYLRYMTYEN